MSTKRSELTSMEGMIWNANYVLKQALNPGLKGIPKGFFMKCAGICVMSTVQAGFMFSGSVGTGIFLKRNEEDGSWSNPVACGMTGIGFGFVIGAAMKDVIIFYPDEASVQACFSTGVKLSAQTNVTLVMGRENESGFGASKSGMSTAISIAYTHGAFMGASLEGAIVAPRTRANENFYGPGNYLPADIVSGKIIYPVDKSNTLIEEVKDKLKKLSMGISETPAEAEMKKEQAALEAANQAAAAIHASSDDIVQIDAQAEAAKE